MVYLIAPRARLWLQDGRPARLLHTFDGVGNLVNDRGEVLSVVSPRIGPGPLNLMVTSEAAVALERREPVCFDDLNRQLTVGGLSIGWPTARLWSPRPEWTRLRRRPAGWPPPEPLPPDIDAHLCHTVAGLVAEDWAACLVGARGLAGRGAGLTPAGDDVLMGILYALWVRSRSPEWAARIVEATAPLTTTLSANLLRAAAEGEARWQWHDVVDGRPDAVAALLAVGHTSGADAWAGFMAVYDTLQLTPPAVNQSVPA